jgi:putative MFS transporter
MAGAVYYFLGLETRGKSIEEIDRELAATAAPPRLQMKGQL